MTDEWKEFELVQSVDCVRTGWPGAWDAIKSAITGRPLSGFARPVTVRLVAKLPVGGAIHTHTSQVEVGGKSK